MNETIHKKQHYEKKGLKTDNPKDVARKRLEQRFKKKQIAKRLQKLSENPDFIDYMFELLQLSGYFNPGEGPSNSQIYGKQGRLQLGQKIADDLTFKTTDGINKIIQIRRELSALNPNTDIEED